MKRILITLAATFALALTASAIAAPPPAQAYMHGANCEAGLRGVAGGDIAVDNDVARHINWLNSLSNHWGAQFEYYHGWYHITDNDVRSGVTFSWLSREGVWTIRHYDILGARCYGNDIAFSDDLYY